MTHSMPLVSSINWQIRSHTPYILHAFVLDMIATLGFISNRIDEGGECVGVGQRGRYFSSYLTLMLNVV
jgi:hypothetical protein